jgi:2-C-methyl-D-erythritol 2,4-cyclodiphosphate synthase
MINNFRIGFGYDIHRVIPGNNGLIVGGVKISDNFEFVAHSDGDLLIHALIDSLLGAAGESDIGELFPNDSKIYKNISSIKLLEKVMEILAKKNINIINIDSTIVLEKPRFSPFKYKIIQNISKILKINKELLNIKSKTKEGIGVVGEGKAIECYCTSLLYLNSPLKK